MATAAKPAELVPHDQFVAEHAARVASINAIRDNEIEEAEQAKTRAHQAHAKTSKLAAAEHATQRLERTGAVVGATLARLHEVTYSGNPRDVARAEILGKHFRHCETATLHALGRPLGDELGVVYCQNFVKKYPDAKALGRFANGENWSRFVGDGLSVFVNRANVALRNEYDVNGQLDALLALDAAVARIGTEPGYGAVDDELALWAIRAACLPGDVAEARYQAHAAEVKARNIVASQAECALRVAAARGDAEARAKIAARGPGVLEALIRNAASILRQVGISEREAAI